MCLLLSLLGGDGSIRVVFTNVVGPSSVVFQIKDVSLRPAVQSVSLNVCHRTSCWKLPGSETLQH